MTPVLRCILVTATLLLARSPGAAAALYSVGSEPGCTHATVQEALSAAASNGSASLHLVKLTTGTLAVPNGLVLHEPRADVRIYGGYTTCTSAQGSNTRTVLDASGGADGAVLDIRASSTGIARGVTLGRLDLVGGSGDAATEGGGVAVRGDVRLTLRDRTRVRGNSALRGGGVFLQGTTHAPSLVINEGSSVQDNFARSDGGGVLCAGSAQVALQSGSIEFNSAGRDGGGVWLGNRCVLSVEALPSAGDTLLLIANNRAGTLESGSGGGVFHRADQPLFEGATDVGFLGRPDAPVMLFNNASLSGRGGALHVEGSGSRRQRITLRNSVFANNTAPASGAAIYAERAIDLELSGARANCGGLFGFGLCSAITGSDSTAVKITGYASGDAATRVRIDRTRFTGNAGLAVISRDTSGASDSTFTIDTSVFDANTVDHAIDSTDSMRLYYSTLVGNTLAADAGGGAILMLLPSAAAVATLELTGSIVWQPGRRTLAPVPRGTVIGEHGGCLLSNDPAGIIAAGPVVTAAPELDGNFIPSATSPALDVCASYAGFAGDAIGGLRAVDYPGVSNGPGIIDLGARERQPPDFVFADSFESPVL